MATITSGIFQNRNKYQGGFEDNYSGLLFLFTFILKILDLYQLNEFVRVLQSAKHESKQRKKYRHISCDIKAVDLVCIKVCVSMLKRN